MTIYYCGTDGNTILVVQVDDNNNNNNNNSSSCNSKILQEISPVAPNPLQLPEGVYNGIATELIVRHPKLPFLFVLTSYWNAMEACVTTFRIQPEDGRLTRMGASVSTQGLHAAHACLSPDDGASLLVIAHHNDGKLVFFDVTCLQQQQQNEEEEQQSSIIQQGNPCCIINTPVVVIPNTRRRTTKPTLLTNLKLAPSKSKSQAHTN